MRFTGHCRILNRCNDFCESDGVPPNSHSPVREHVLGRHPPRGNRNDSRAFALPRRARALYRPVGERLVIDQPRRRRPIRLQRRRRAAPAALDGKHRVGCREGRERVERQVRNEEHRVVVEARDDGDVVRMQNPEEQVGVGD